MAERIGSVEEIQRETRVAGVSDVYAAQEGPLSRELNAVEEETNRVAQGALSQTELPSAGDSLDLSRVTAAPAIADKVAGAAGQGSSEPHLALESLNAALQHERRAITQLRGAEDETNTLLKTIDQLLDLSSELTTLKDRDQYELSDKMKEILGDLKEKGIDLLKGDQQTLSKEQLAELKSAIGARSDNSRTKVQQVFTKMQTIIQNMMSVNDSAKRIISEFTQLLRTISRNMRP